MPGNKYTAGSKWESDKNKINRLSQLGYTVIVIWESDDIDDKRKVINAIMV